MKLLAENDEVLTFLVNNQSLISSTMNSFFIKGTNEGVTVEITFSSMYSSQVSKLMLVFENAYATEIDLQRGRKSFIYRILHISIPHFFIWIPFQLMITTPTVRFSRRSVSQ